MNQVYSLLFEDVFVKLYGCCVVLKVELLVAVTSFCLNFSKIIYIVQLARFYLHKVMVVYLLASIFSSEWFHMNEKFVPFFFCAEN